MGTRERRLRERNRRIREIEVAAKKIFFKKGYQNTTMEEIAAIAEVSKGTIYLYFKNKDDLYVTLMMTALEELGKLLLHLEAEVMEKKKTACAEVIMGLFRIFAHVYGKYAEELRIIRAFEQGDRFLALSKELLERINGRARTNYEIARRIISRIPLKNLSKRINRVRLVDVLWSTFMGVIQQEESKLRATQKNHILSTLEYAFVTLSRGMC
jgi:AcrR family transcriptional regulator